MRILLASSNEHKRHEFSQLFPNHEILLPTDLGLSFDCIEDAPSFLGNAMIKATALYEVSRHLGLPILADDSGLMVKALPGRLGVKTARFGSEDGGKPLSAHEKNSLLLCMLKDKTKDEREAFFVCSLVLLVNPYRTYSATESTAGYILDEETGVHGFGYDPVFYCNEAQSPMALLSEEQKNMYSHRGKAARSIERFLNEL